MNYSARYHLEASHALSAPILPPDVRRPCRVRPWKNRTPLRPRLSDSPSASFSKASASFEDSETQSPDRAQLLCCNCRRRREFIQAAADGARGDAGDPRRCRNAAVTRGRGFSRCEQPPTGFVEMWRQSLKTFANSEQHRPCPRRECPRTGYDPELGIPPGTRFSRFLTGPNSLASFLLR